MSFGVGKIVAYLNELRYAISLQAINAYLDYRLTAETDELIYKIGVSAALNALASERRLKDYHTYADDRKMLYKAKDERTAEQIITETFAAHKIKVV